jgi:hypothetical protein
MTPRELAEDDALIDKVRGRRYCSVHRDQEMIPMLPGMDVCPVSHGEEEGPEE